MIKSALKVFAIVVATVLFLSITIHKKPIFAHLYQFISPGTMKAQQATEDFFASSVTSTRSYSKKIFDNSVPKFKDSVGSKRAAPVRAAVVEPLESIKVEEKQELDELIKSHH